MHREKNSERKRKRKKYTGACWEKEKIGGCGYIGDSKYNNSFFDLITKNFEY